MSGSNKKRFMESSTAHFLAPGGESSRGRSQPPFTRRIATRRTCEFHSYDRAVGLPSVPYPSGKRIEYEVDAAGSRPQKFNLNPN